MCYWCDETCSELFCWLSYENNWKNFKRPQLGSLEQFPPSFLTPYLPYCGGLLAAAEKSQTLGYSWVCLWVYDDLQNQTEWSAACLGLVPTIWVCQCGHRSCWCSREGSWLPRCPTTMQVNELLCWLVVTLHHPLVQRAGSGISGHKVFRIFFPIPRMFLSRFAQGGGSGGGKNTSNGSITPSKIPEYFKIMCWK